MYKNHDKGYSEKSLESFEKEKGMAYKRAKHKLF